MTKNQEMIAMQHELTVGFYEKRGKTKQMAIVHMVISFCPVIINESQFP